MSKQIFPSEKTPDVHGFTVTDPIGPAGAGMVLEFDLEYPDGKASTMLRKVEVRDLIDRLNAWDIQR